MAKLLKNRIKSIKTTRKITKAMQLVATSHLKQARLNFVATKPYDEMIVSTLAEMLAIAPEKVAHPLLTGNGKQDKYLLIVCTASKGLCGSFNSSVIKLAKKEIETLKANGKEVLILALGKRGYESLENTYPESMLPHIDKVIDHGIVNLYVFEQVMAMVMDMFYEGRFDICHVFYNQFQSLLVQVEKKQKVVPYIHNMATVIDYEYDVPKQDIIDELAVKNLIALVHGALLQSAMGEQAARMKAMDSATRNSDQLLGKLNILYNRTRQRHITDQLIEIISGFEAA